MLKNPFRNGIIAYNIIIVNAIPTVTNVIGLII